MRRFSRKGRKRCAARRQLPSPAPKGFRYVRTILIKYSLSGTLTNDVLHENIVSHISMLAMSLAPTPLGLLGHSGRCPTKVQILKKTENKASRNLADPPNQYMLGHKKLTAGAVHF